MEDFAHRSALWISVAGLGLVVASIVWALRRWRFDRLALRGFDLPFEPASPFRQSEAKLRPLFGFEPDPGAQLFFVLHLLAALGGISSMAMTLWCAVTILDGVSMTATTIAALAGSSAALLAVPMWLGHRVAHGVVAGVMAVLMLGLWPPALTLLLVIVVIQHDLIRRRAIADAREQERRREHERRRQATAGDRPAWS